MNPGMMVDGQEIQERVIPQQPLALRVIAQAISWIFHPVFVPIMVVWFLLFEHPYLFAGFAPFLKFRIMMIAVVCFTFFPLVTVLLLKGLKFIDTIYLHTQKDRVIPFIACMIWYFWIAYVWFNFGKTSGGADIPKEAVLFASAAFMSTILGLLVNIKMKVSLHAISAGIALSFFFLMALTQSLHFGYWLSAVLLLTGLICTARMIVSDHTQQEIYGGLITGAASVLLARALLGMLG